MNLEPSRWAASWLHGLLSSELPLAKLILLWDAYIGMGDFLETHMYVCLAILKNMRQSLMELDQAELLQSIRQLPPLDTENILKNAKNLQLDLSYII